MLRKKVVFARLSDAEYESVRTAAAAQGIGPWARASLLHSAHIIESQEITHPQRKHAERSERKRAKRAKPKPKRRSKKNIRKRSRGGK